MPIPTPEPGLVISYAYLWHREREAGRDEGRKDRPSVIVLAVERRVAEPTAVVVLPITHAPPADRGAGVEIPGPIKLHLGLDEKRSWVIVSEGNEFDWPGYDLRKIGTSDRYDYGFLPPRFFNQIINAFTAWHRASKGKLVSRGLARAANTATTMGGELASRQVGAAPKQKLQQWINGAV